MPRSSFCRVVRACAALACVFAGARAAQIPDSAPLTWSGDIASRLVDQADAFLSRELREAPAKRRVLWEGATSRSPRWRAEKRERLSFLLGVRDRRVEAPFLRERREAFDVVSAAGSGVVVRNIEWSAFGEARGEGLLVSETGLDEEDLARKTHIIAIPDADQSPEAAVGLAGGASEGRPFARRLAGPGRVVYAPALIDRGVRRRAAAGGGGGSELTHREFVYRPAFEMGRGVLGYEIQRVLALVDWIVARAGEDPRIGVFGYGEGGLLALYAAALDPRIDAVCVSGAFGALDRVWEQPVDRNVFGLLREFGDGEIASLVAPRRLIVETAEIEERRFSSRGGAPGVLRPPAADAVNAAVARARELAGEEAAPDWLTLSPPADSDFAPSSAATALLAALGEPENSETSSRLADGRALVEDAGARRARMIGQLDRHTQELLADSGETRRRFMSGLQVDSVESLVASAGRYRSYFETQIVGRFDYPLAPFRTRSRLAYERAAWTGYEVALDVFRELFAYGVLLIPEGLKDGERRPVIVCQHGLEGRPADVIEGDHRAYHDFAAKLCARGYVVFAPQNLYLFGDRFRTLQRKANPLGKTLFSLITPQHRQIVRWLQSLPFVDGDRVAFYGLSYGGKTAMRVGALVEEYCAVICSADFNDWIWKCASTRSPYSYVWTGEYEIFEFDLGNTFNYSEMAALIAPRPFMVERGHFDGVAPDERVGYEFAKARRLYQARLGIGDRCEIEWFAGPHTIHGVGAFAFLDRWLKSPREASP